MSYCSELASGEFQDLEFSKSCRQDVEFSKSCWQDFEFSNLAGKILNFPNLVGKELDKFREKYNEAIKNQLADYQLKRQKSSAKDSPSLDRQKKKIRVAGFA